MGTVASVLHQVVNKASLLWCPWRPHREPGLPPYVVIMRHPTPSFLEWCKRRSSRDSELSQPVSYNEAIFSQCQSKPWGWVPGVHRVHVEKMYFHHFFYLTGKSSHALLLIEMVSQKGYQNKVFNYDLESHKIIPQMPRFHLIITLHAKNQKNLNLNDKRQRSYTDIKIFEK